MLYTYYTIVYCIVFHPGAGSRRGARHRNGPPARTDRAPRLAKAYNVSMLYYCVVSCRVVSCCVVLCCVLFMLCCIVLCCIVLHCIVPGRSAPLAFEDGLLCQRSWHALLLAKARGQGHSLLNYY